MLGQKKLMQNANRVMKQVYREGWEQHRKITSKLIEGAFNGKVSPDILIVGAGNCNDVDIVDIMKKSARVDLIDIDGDSVKEALKAKVPYSLEKKARVISTDITPISKNGGLPYGVLKSLLNSRDVSAFTEKMQKLCTGRADLHDCLSQYDVIVILPVFTQLFGPFFTNVAKDSWLSDFNTMMEKFGTAIDDIDVLLSRQVLDHMWDLLSPTGSIVIITDVLDFFAEPWRSKFDFTKFNQLDITNSIKSAMEIGTFSSACGVAEWLDEHRSSWYAISSWIWGFTEKKYYAVVGYVLNKNAG